MDIRLNEYHEDLFCTYCKEQIYPGEKYAVLREQLYDGEVIEKFYHINEMCIPETEDEEDYFIEDNLDEF